MAGYDKFELLVLMAHATPIKQLGVKPDHIHWIEDAIKRTFPHLQDRRFPVTFKNHVADPTRIGFTYNSEIFKRPSRSCARRSWSLPQATGSSSGLRAYSSLGSGFGTEETRLNTSESSRLPKRPPTKAKHFAACVFGLAMVYPHQRSEMSVMQDAPANTCCFVQHGSS